MRNSARIIAAGSQSLAQGADASAKLGEAVARYEALQDLLGRLMSFAGLLYSGDTTDPARAKFYGDVQEKVTNASAQLLFFQLELNRLDDADVDGGGRARSRSRAGSRGSKTSARRSLTNSKTSSKSFSTKNTSPARPPGIVSSTKQSPSLRFKVGGEELAIEPVLNLMQDSREETRREAAQAIGETLKNNLRTFSLITNTLAKDKEISDRWRGFEDVADSRHLSNRVEREVVEALAQAVEAAHPRLSHRYYKLKAKWFGKDALDYWDRSAPLPATPAKRYSWPEAREIVLERLRAALRRAWRRSPGASSRRTGSTRQCGRARRRAPSRIRPCLPRIPMCC